MFSTHQLYLDLIRRKTLELPLNNSPELIAPYILRYIKLKRIAKGENRADYLRLSKLDPNQFFNFFSYEVTSSKELIDKLTDYAPRSMHSVQQRWARFLRNSMADYIHPKNGEEFLTLHFAS